MDAWDSRCLHVLWYVRRTSSPISHDQPRAQQRSGRYCVQAGAKPALRLCDTLANNTDMQEIV